jgi:hypothetical protein
METYDDVTDYLILCIHDNEIAKTFIFYDLKTSKYEIRGKNNDFKEINYDPFSFSCGSITSLYEFLKFNFYLQDNEVNVTLYNYNHLPEFSNEITYEFLESSEENKYELFAYRNCNLNRKKCKKLLQMIRDIRNDY